MPLHKKITLSDYLLKKYCKPISRILYPVWQREVIIYLAVTLLQQSCCLPFPIPIKTGSKRAAYLAHKRKPGYTWHYSTQGLPKIVITYNHRELLPHVFTFSLEKQLYCLTQVVYFLWHYLPGINRDRLLTGVSPFAGRTFLP